jgi:hypothetical protein
MSDTTTAPAPVPPPATSHFRLFLSRVAADLENVQTYESIFDTFIKIGTAISPFVASPVVQEVVIGSTLGKELIESRRTVTPISGPSVVMSQSIAVPESGVATEAQETV